MAKINDEWEGILYNTCPKYGKKFKCEHTLQRHINKFHSQPIIPEGDSFYSEYCREFQGAGAEQ